MILINSRRKELVLSFIVFTKDEFLPISIHPSLLPKINDINFYKKVSEGSYQEHCQSESYSIYIKKSEHSKFLEKVFQLANKSSTDQIIELSKNLIQNLEMNGLTSENYQFVKEASNSIIELNQNKDFKTLIHELVKSGKIPQSLFISVFSRLIAKKLGWENKQNIKKLVIAGFLANLEDSVISCAERVKAITGDEDIYLAIKFHKENMNGTGPFGMNREKIHPFARVIRVSEEFYRFYKKNQVNEGLDFLKDQRSVKFDSAIVKSLFSLFNRKMV